MNDAGTGGGGDALGNRAMARMMGIDVPQPEAVRSSELAGEVARYLAWALRPDRAAHAASTKMGP